MQVQLESQRGRCRSLASDQCYAKMASLQVGTKFSALQCMVQSMQMGSCVFVEGAVLSVGALDL